MTRLGALITLVLVLCGCRQEIDLSLISPPEGRPVCLGHHTFVIPDDTTATWSAAYIDGQSIRVLRSDGRSARAQMDRHGESVTLGRVWTERRLNGWDFAVYETTDPGHPFRYEVGATLVGDSLVLTVGRHSKSMVSDPAELDGVLLHRTMRAVPAGDGYGGPGFCIDGIALEGQTVEIGEIIELSLPGTGQTVSLRVNYLGPGSDVPAFGLATAGPSADGIQQESVSFRHAGQDGIATVFTEEGRPGGGAEAELKGEKGSIFAPHVVLRVSLSSGDVEALRLSSLSLIAGFSAR